MPAAKRACLAMFAVIAMTLALLLAIAALAAPARAHGDADWINKGGYRNAAGELCCGKNDCFELAPARVLVTPRGYELLDEPSGNGSHMIVPHEERQVSEDGKYWLCKVGFRRRCFFAPHQGF